MTHRNAILPPMLEPEPGPATLDLANQSIENEFRDQGPTERLLLVHPSTGLTVTEDLDTGGVWIKQETGATMEQVYVCKGAWMVLRDAAQRGLV